MDLEEKPAGLTPKAKIGCIVGLILHIVAFGGIGWLIYDAIKKDDKSPTMPGPGPRKAGLAARKPMQ